MAHDDPEFAAAMLDAVPVGMLVIDPAGTITYASSSEEALTTGVGVFPETLVDYDIEFRTAATDAGLTTVWAYPVPGPSGQGGPKWSSCVVIGRIETGAVTINERLNIEMVVRNAAIVFERDYFG